MDGMHEVFQMAAVLQTDICLKLYFQVLRNTGPVTNVNYILIPSPLLFDKEAKLEKLYWGKWIHLRKKQVSVC